MPIKTEECKHENLSAYAVTNSVLCVRLIDGDCYYETNHFPETTIHVTCYTCGEQWEGLGSPPSKSEVIPDNVRRVANEMNYRVYNTDRGQRWN